MKAKSFYATMKLLLHARLQLLGGDPNEQFLLYFFKTVLEDADMPRYVVTLTDGEIQELKALVQKGGKGYRIRHAQILIKLDQKPENKSWTYDCINIPQADAESVAKMEDVLGVYQRPYDPLNPVVCIDEMDKQMIKEISIPCESGRPEKVDSVYICNGVADVFMISEPLAGRRKQL